ncbi:hypothetical protein ACFQFH_05490 [Halobaculum halobium]|uniref:hypothetical protein n=1 Tax=Halobaculum halobium TaxID=3032281 RepID=UPI003609ABDA
MAGDPQWRLPCRAALTLEATLDGAVFRLAAVGRSTLAAVDTVRPLAVGAQMPDLGEYSSGGDTSIVSVTRWGT